MILEYCVDGGTVSVLHELHGRHVEEGMGLRRDADNNKGYSRRIERK